MSTAQLQKIVLFFIELVMQILNLGGLLLDVLMRDVELRSHLSGFCSEILELRILLVDLL